MGMCSNCGNPEGKKTVELCYSGSRYRINSSRPKGAHYIVPQLENYRVKWTIGSMVTHKQRRFEKVEARSRDS